MTNALTLYSSTDKVVHVVYLPLPVCRAETSCQLRSFNLYVLAVVLPLLTLLTRNLRSVNIEGTYRAIL